MVHPSLCEHGGAPDGRSIRVRNGDRVEAGDVLLRLDPTELRLTETALRGQLDALEAAIARLTSEQSGREEIAFPGHFIPRQNETGIHQMMARHRQLFLARAENRSRQIAVLDATIARLETEAAEARREAVALAEQIAIVATEAEAISELVEETFAPQTQLNTLQRTLADLNGQRESQLLSAEQSRRAIIETEQQKAAFRSEGAEAIAAELAMLEDEARVLEDELRAIAARLANLEIVATETGTVLNLVVFTSGAVIAPAEALLEIVPDGDELIIEAPIALQDIDSLRVGLPTDVQFSALNPVTTPKLSGHVTYVSADSLHLSGAQQGPAYLARVALPKSELAKLGDIPLTPGMPADILIKTGTRTAFQYLTSPLTDRISAAWREE